MSRIALVTGAARGIGRACCDALAADGWQIIALDLQFDETAWLETLAVDLNDQQALAATLQDIQSKHSIDCVVNCAGITRLGRFVDQDASNWPALVQVNYLAPLQICQSVLPGMIERGRGSIIQITSDAARAGAAGESVYAGTKSALVGFSKSIAQEVGRHGIRVNCVSPGVIKTPMSAPNAELLEKFARRVPMKRLGEAEDVAGAVRFLASDESHSITGQVLSVGGGLTMVE
jgi:2-hydroxycyclohexanecarboxyl-CoA dehydrogenase